MNILQVEKYCLLIEYKQQNNLGLYILFYEKLWKKQTEKQFNPLKSLEFFNKTNELKQMEVKNC